MEWSQKLPQVIHGTLSVIIQEYDPVTGGIGKSGHHGSMLTKIAGQIHHLQEGVSICISS